MWSASQHREQLKQFPTLYRDTRDFIQNISSLKALPVHYFVRLDIEEIFMSGDPEILACDAAGLAEEGPGKRLLYDVDHFLLTHQFVTSKRHPERLWRVQKGSGMGMKNSGEVSDAAFPFLVERWCVSPDTMNAFSIDLYGRFKDDIITVAKNRVFTKHFVWGMKHRSKYYKIKVEEISDITVKFLEVRVWKHGSRSVTGLEFKPTSLWHWERTVHMLLTAIYRGPQRESPCLVRCREHQPSSRKPTGIDQQVYLALCTGAHHRKNLLLQSDVAPSLMECGLL